MDIGKVSADSFLGQLLAVVSGAVLGVVMHRLLGEIGWDMTLDPLPITGRDAVVFALSAVLMMWGGKVSTYLRYAGVGMFSWQLGHELTDVLWT